MVTFTALWCVNDLSRPLLGRRGARASNRNVEARWNENKPTLYYSSMKAHNCLCKWSSAKLLILFFQIKLWQTIIHLTWKWVVILLKKTNQKRSRQEKPLDIGNSSLKRRVLSLLTDCLELKMKIGTIYILHVPFFSSKDSNYIFYAGNTTFNQIVMPKWFCSWIIMLRLTQAPILNNTPSP